MLAIATVKRPRYYVDTAQGRTDFDPMRTGEPPGEWLETAGAAFFGFLGRVKRSDFLSLTQDFAQHEATASIQLSRPARQVPGWD